MEPRDLPERAGDALRVLGVRTDDRLGVAVSGGADSVALLHLLRSRCPSVHVLHVDHGLRPGSELDAHLVSVLADELELACSVRRVEVSSDPSVEASARMERYRALREMAEGAGLCAVATGHTRDDQAETVLLRALRGAGVAGLAGIAPRRGVFVRPLLGFGRAELRAWLVANGFGWLEDPTNTDLAFERNWVRHVLMPQLNERRSGVSRTLARLADHARADEGALDALALEVVDRVSSDELGSLVRTDDLAPLPTAVASRVVRHVMWRLGAEPTSADVDDVLALATASRGRRRLGVVTLHRIPEGLCFVREPAEVPEPVVLPRRGELTVPAWGLRVRVGPAGAPAWGWRSVVPPGRLTLRSRRAGDRVGTPRGTRKLQDVLVDAKVPRLVRDRVPVLDGPGGPLGVVGVSPSAAPAPGGDALVVDARPVGTAWSRTLWWKPAS